MTCWFCSIREAAAKCAVKFDMYGDVDAKNDKSQTSVAYNVRHIEIPRCEDCKARHRLARAFLIAAVVFAGALIAAVPFAVFGWITPLVSGIWLGLAAGLLAGALLSSRLIQRGILEERKSRSDFPEVKDLLEKCYRFGARPKDPLPQSDPPCEPKKAEEPEKAESVDTESL